MGDTSIWHGILEILHRELEEDFSNTIPDAFLRSVYHRGCLSYALEKRRPGEGSLVCKCPVQLLKRASMRRNGVKGFLSASLHQVLLNEGLIFWCQAKRELQQVAHLFKVSVVPSCS